MIRAVVLALFVVACGAAPPAPITRGAAPACQLSLHVPWVPTAVSDAAHVELVTTFTSGAGSAAARFVSDETVLATTATGDAARVRVVFAEATFARTGSATLDLGSRTLEMAADHTAHPTTKFTLDGADPPEELAPMLMVFDRHEVGQPYWLARVLADRTFVQGVATRLDAIRTFDNLPGSLSITLLDVAGETAHFAIAGTQTKDTVVTTWTAKVAYDVRRARPLSNDDTTSMTDGTRVVSGRTMTTWRYTGTPGGSPARPHCARTLHLPFRAPVVGEATHASADVAMDSTLRALAEERVFTRLRGAWSHDSTREVRAVAGDAPTHLVFAVRRAAWQGITDEEPPPPAVMRDETVALVVEPTGIAVLRAGTRVELPDAAFAVWMGDLGRRNWIERLVTDRDFEVGVTSVFPRERIGLFGSDPCDVRVTLRSHTATEATFDLVIAQETFMEDGRGTWMDHAGTLVFDLATSRPRSFTLRGKGRPPAGARWAGEITFAFRWKPVPTDARAR